MLDQLIKDRSGNIWVAGCNVPSFIVSFSKGIVTHTVQPVQQSSRHIATFLAVCHDDEPNVFGCSRSDIVYICIIYKRSS